MTVLLTDFDKLKTILELKKTESDYASLIVLQDGVVAQFESFTRRKFELVSRRHIRYIHCETVMIDLKAIPICVVDSCKVDDVDVGYKITSYGLCLAESIEQGKIDITYTGGLECVDEDLCRAATIQTVFEYQNKHSVGIRSTSNDGGTTTKDTTGLLKEVQSILTLHQHPFRLF